MINGRIFVMNVAIDLRMVQTTTLEVVDVVSYQKQIVGREVSAGVFDFLNPDTGNPWLAWLVRFAMIVLLGVLNVFGAKAIGDSSKVFLAIVLAPFVLVTIIGVFNMDRNPVEPFVLEGLSPAAAFGAGLFVVMWNYMGWDSMSTFASWSASSAPWQPSKSRSLPRRR